MPKRSHWMDTLSDDIREDMADMVEDIREAFSDMVPLGGPQRLPPIKERVKSYLTMQPQERQMLFLELGVDGYTEFVNRAMDDLVKVFGSNASAALSWFMGVGPELGMSPDEAEMATIQALGQSPVQEEA